MNTLLVLSVPRCIEKITPLIASLSAKGAVDCYHIGEMSEETKWAGDKDIRRRFKAKYRHLIKEFIEGPGFEHWGDNTVAGRAFEDLDSSNYDVVLVDDNRSERHLGFPKLSQMCRANKVPLLGTPHANGNLTNLPVQNLNLYDYIFCYGPLDYNAYCKVNPAVSKRFIQGGYPPTQNIKTALEFKNKKHILCVLNLLGFRSKGVAGVQHHADEEFIKKLKLGELQDKLGLPIIFKIKSRYYEKEHHNYDWKESVNYVSNLAKKEGLTYNTVTDCLDDTFLLLDSGAIVSCSPTMTLKALSTLNPVIHIAGSSMMGSINQYPYLLDLDKDNLISMYESFDVKEAQHYMKYVLADDPINRYIWSITQVAEAYQTVRV